MKPLFLLLILTFLASCTIHQVAVPKPVYTFDLHQLPNGQISVIYHSDILGWRILMGESEDDVSGETAYYMFSGTSTGCENRKHDRISTPMFFRVVSSDGVIDEVKKI